jgi:hypothetical protein
MAGNTVALEFAGDATKLQKAAKAATAATDDVARASKEAGVGMERAAGQSRSFGRHSGCRPGERGEAGPRAGRRGTGPNRQ